MANTYTQLHIHCVFAVKYRRAVLDPEWDERLRQYIIGILEKQKHKTLAINNVFDHLHFFVGLNPSQSISDMMKWVKGESSEWINNNKFVKHDFRWQEGYGAFSHSHSQIDKVVKYILNQQEHHRKINFLDEYKKMLTDSSVKYDDRYIFKPLID